MVLGDEETLLAEMQRSGLVDKCKEGLEKDLWTGNPREVGSIVTLGRYPQEGSTATAIEWQVLDVADGKSLLLSRYALDARRYHEEFESVTWETCTLRRWLNLDFLQNAFTVEEQGAIRTKVLENLDNERLGTKGGSNTNDKVFLLSLVDVEQYFSTKEERLCIPTKYALSRNGNIVIEMYKPGCTWWLRSPGIDCGNAAIVWPDGSYTDVGYGVDGTYTVYV